MELVEGRTLAARIADGHMPLAEILDLGQQIAEALEAAHTSGVVHRDIKPANLMVTSSGHVKVLDFGLARHRHLQDAGYEPTKLSVTSPGLVIGTVAYMSPEQAAGQPVDHRTDLFSLGVVLYQAAATRLPFAGRTALHTFGLIAGAEPDPISRPGDAGAPEFDRIVRKCLQKQPERRYQSAHDLLIDLQTLSRDLAAGRAGDPFAVRRHNLPEQLTTFVGKRAEVAQLHRAMASTRLLTLTGAGGCGKTRLALEVAAEYLPHAPDGVWLVDLSPLSDPELVPHAVAAPLHISEGPHRSPTEALVEHVRTRHLLLVLDNCEHLIGACAALVDLLLRSAAQLRILATTREALGVHGETIWRVPSLSVPPADALTADTILQFEAARLFVDRAAAVAPFALSDTSAIAVAEICRRLDGIPLAIELAAVRVSVLSVEQINARLKDRFRLLTGGCRTAVARQRTLEATVGWSYDLLVEPERRALCRLSAFAGGWTLGAAEDVCSGEGIERDDVLDLLTRLVDKSLAAVDDTATGERRYRLLETIRQYARDRLFASGEIDAVAARHFRFFFALARRAEPELIRGEQVAWLDRVQNDDDNIRAALDWAFTADGQGEAALEMAARLWWFWVKRGLFSEGQRRLEAALACCPGPPTVDHAKAHVGLMHCMSFRGDPATPEVVAQSLATARRAEDPLSEAYSLGAYAILESDRGEFDRAAAHAREAHRVALAIPTDNAERHGPLALSLRMLAYAALQEGNLDAAGNLFEQVVAMLRAAQNWWSLGIVLSDLAALRALQGRYADARILGCEAIEYCQQMGDRRGIAWCLQTFAMVEAAEGQPTRAAQLFGAAEGLLDTVGATGQLTVTRVQDRHMTRAIDALGEASFRASAATGRAMSLRQAIRYTEQS